MKEVIKEKVISKSKTFEEGWKEHSRYNKNLHYKLDSCRIRVTKLTNRNKELNKELKNKNVGYKGLIERNIELQNRLFYELRVNNELKQKIKKFEKELGGGIKDNKTQYHHT